MSKSCKYSNFTALEKTILLELIDSRKDIIENMQNDGKMVSKKISEWEKITSEFNASHGVNQRTCTQLKPLWKNMKSRTKSAVAKDRRRKQKLVAVHKQVRDWTAFSQQFPQCFHN